MKTEFNTNMKDNVAAATLLAASVITILGGLVTSGNAHADKAPQSQVRQMEVQRMETIIVTAPRYTTRAIKS